MDSDGDIIVCLPMVLDGPEDFMGTADGRRLTGKMLQELTRCTSVSKVVVIASDPLIEALIPSGELRFVLVREPIDFNPQLSFIDNVNLFPSWARYLPGDASTLFLNFRNPLLSAERLDQALTAFFETAADVLLSMVRSVDHPCQLYFADRESGGLKLYLSGDDRPYYKRPFPPASHLWRFEDDGQRLVNVREAKDIQGRQEYPAIYEADDSFFIGTSRVIHSSASAHDPLRRVGHLIPSDESIVLSSRLDYLRLLALQKAELPLEGTRSCFNTPIGASTP